MVFCKQRNRTTTINLRKSLSQKNVRFCGIFKTKVKKLEQTKPDILLENKIEKESQIIGPFCTFDAKDRSKERRESNHLWLIHSTRNILIPCSFSMYARMALHNFLFFLNVFSPILNWKIVPHLREPSLYYYLT